MYDKIAFLVSGKVQGVCFRAYAQDTARNLDVTGWVRNRADGRVEGEAFGVPDKIKAFIDWLHVGSPFGRVTAVEATPPSRQARRPPSFDIRYG